MQHQFLKVQAAIQKAIARRDAWVQAKDARQQEASAFNASVEKCFNEIVKPGMQRLHRDASRVGYRASVNDESSDAGRVASVQLVPSDATQGERKGKLSVTADPSSLELAMLVEIEAPGGTAHRFKPVTRKPLQLTASDFERELVRLVLEVMQWPDVSKTAMTVGKYPNPRSAEGG